MISHEINCNYNHRPPIPNFTRLKPKTVTATLLSNSWNSLASDKLYNDPCKPETKTIIVTYLGSHIIILCVFKFRWRVPWLRSNTITQGWKLRPSWSCHCLLTLHIKIHQSWISAKFNYARLKLSLWIMMLFLKYSHIQINLQRVQKIQMHKAGN